jgi:hypothetical protein
MNLPSNKKVKDLIEGMLGRPVTLEPADELLSPVDTVGGLIATYCDDSSHVRGMLGWSSGAGAIVGCALGLIAAPMAQEMAVERSLPADIVDNLAEASNIMAALFDLPGNPHVRMGERYYPSATTPPELAALMYLNPERLDWELTVKGYGTGKVSLVSRG